jgi:SlyX protein
MASDSQSRGVASGLQDETLADIQMRLTYQEDEIRHLNQTLERQRTELDDLKREIGRVKRQLALLAPTQVGSQAGEKPPHY